MSSGSVVSFFVLIICTFSFFLSVFLEVCQFYWSFQRTSSSFHRFSLLFSVCKFHWFLFLSLIFPSFHLPLGLFSLHLLGSWGGRFGYWYETFLFFNISPHIFFSALLNCVSKLLICCIFIFFWSEVEDARRSMYWLYTTIVLQRVWIAK